MMGGLDLSFLALALLIPIWWIAVSLGKIARRLDEKSDVTVVTNDDERPTEVRGNNNRISIVRVRP